jgi:hypothetical protein
MSALARTEPTRMFGEAGWQGCKSASQQVSKSRMYNEPQHCGR